MSKLIYIYTVMDMGCIQNQSGHMYLGAALLMLEGPTQ